MKRYILTGTPGAGKTAILRCLELDGSGVVEEAATDIIALQQAEGAEPWSHASFIDAIVNLQREPPTPPLAWATTSSSSIDRRSAPARSPSISATQSRRALN